MRNVIVHYHIYKNSGTSFDSILTHNFGEKHILFDGPFPFFTISQDQLDRIISRKRETIAFSSHQIVLPQPVSLDYKTYAALFVRNPILRIGSIYRFKKQSNDGTLTSREAVKNDFSGWIRFCLKHPQEVTHISNAQTRQIGAAFAQLPLRKRSKTGMLYDLETAKRNLSNVELLGRTEHFSEDVERFAQILSKAGIQFEIPETLHLNATEKTTQHIEERVQNLLAELDRELRDTLLEINQQDFSLYKFACELIKIRGNHV